MTLWRRRGGSTATNQEERRARKSGSSSFVEHLIAIATLSCHKGGPFPREAWPRPPSHPPDDPGVLRPPTPQTRGCGRRLVGPPGLSHHVFRVRLLRLPGDFAGVAKRPAHIRTFRPSGRFDKARANMTAETFDHEKGSDRKPVWIDQLFYRSAPILPQHNGTRSKATILSCPFVAKRRWDCPDAC